MKTKTFYCSPILLSFASNAFAPNTSNPTTNKADTIWILLCSTPVLFITPDLLYFTEEWIVIGYSPSFEKGVWGIIGDFEEHVFFKDAELNPSSICVSPVPILTFVLFQVIFTIITPAFISGAIVERMNFPPIFRSLYYFGQP